jgi:TetR/AcrR family transcriptional repressor of nem operon
MPRASRTDAEKHRQAVVASAARLFRERGLHGVSIPEIMADASLTHGGFYRNFESKDELAGEACARAFDELDAMTVDITDRHVSDSAGWREFVETYLSPSHRDGRGTGCPAAGLCTDVAREAPKSGVRRAYVGGVQRVVRRLSHLLSRIGDRSERRDDTLAKYATLVGALVLSRATRGEPISDDILAAARRTLLT